MVVDLRAGTETTYYKKSGPTLIPFAGFMHTKKQKFQHEFINDGAAFDFTYKSTDCSEGEVERVGTEQQDK